jgi:hypothetical protein
MRPIINSRLICPLDDIKPDVTTRALLKIRYGSSFKRCKFNLGHQPNFHECISRQPVKEKAKLTKEKRAARPVSVAGNFPRIERVKSFHFNPSVFLAQK